MTHTDHDDHAVQTDVVLIPLNKLKKSPANARKTPHSKGDIEALAASIHAKGLLQNLVVQPELSAAGARTGLYLVEIGEGRRQAQLLRVKRKQIKDDEPVRCVIDTKNDPLEISLDENVTRSPMSVMDEVEAFARLVDNGMCVDDVARRFGCAVRLVEQRLALGRLSPKIRAAYRKGDINLDVARAFAINGDHSTQERVFRQFAKPITHAPSVRSALTAGRLPAHDRLARFVGLEAYEAAGGTLVRDLFETDIVFLEDGALLQKLAGEKAEALRAKMAKEGWGWVEIQLGHGQVEGCAGERLHPALRKLKPNERKQAEDLRARLAELEQDLEEADDDDRAWAEHDDVEAKLEAIHQAARVYDKKLIRHAGALVAVDRDGRPVITRGLIKRADLKTLAKLRANTTSMPDEGSGEDADTTAPSDDGDSPRLTKALLERLTQARTRGLRACLAGNAHVALALMVYLLMRQSADRSAVPGVAIASRPIGFDDDDDFEKARLTFAERAVDDEAGFLAACIDQPIARLVEALAVFMAETLDFTQRGLMAEDARLQQMADALAAALHLDMRRHWEASEDFFQAAPKALAIAALETAPSLASLSAAERQGMIAAFAKMKKGELAKTAAQALKDTGWLPDILRTPATRGAFAVTAPGERVLAQGDKQAT